MSEPLLIVEKLTASYDDALVLRDISFTVSKQEVVSLLGPNGAGKSTTMMALTGIIRSTGQIYFDGSDIAQIPSHRRVNLGIALSPEGRQIFPALSVEENLKLGSFSPRGRSQRNDNLEKVYAMFVRLAERRLQLAGVMSGGEQQMLAIGRALMSSPRLLLLDEPSLGLAPIVVDQVYASIRKIAAAGVSILLVEQNTEAALSVAERGYVISNGVIVATGDSSTLRNSASLKEAFFGYVAQPATSAASVL